MRLVLQNRLYENSKRHRAGCTIYLLKYRSTEKLEVRGQKAI